MSTDHIFRQWITQKLVPELVEHNKLTSKQIIAVKSIDIRLQTANEVFALTFCYFVQISGITPDGNGDAIETFSIVVKLAPKLDPPMYNKFQFHNLFANEIFTYEHIQPKIRCLSKGLKYFYSHNANCAAAIVLSDFSKDGWTMSKSPFDLSIDHILSAVELLGRFHGNMYALKLTDESNFNCMKDSLVEARFSIDGATTEWMHCLNFGAMRAIQAVEQSSQTNLLVPSEFLKRLSVIMRSVYFYQWNCVKPKEPYAVICHGDYLRNNIAFRYDGNGLVNDAMMFDFQTMRYASPMIDMSTFLANSTGCEVRNKHFKHIFKAYHDALTLELLANVPGWNTTDIPDYLTHDSMLKEYARYMPYGLGVAGSFLHILIAPTDIVSDEPQTIGQITDERIEEIRIKSFTSGGEVVDKELRSLVVDMYQMYTELGMKLEEWA